MDDFLYRFGCGICGQKFSDSNECETHMEVLHMMPGFAEPDFTRNRINLTIPGGKTMYVLTVQEAHGLIKSLTDAVVRYAEKGSCQPDADTPPQQS